MACAMHPQIEHARILAMNALQQAGQTLLSLRDQNQMDVIGHEAIGLDRNAIVAGEFPEQIEVEQAIFLTIKDFLAIIAPLRDVMRDTRDDDAVGSWHIRLVP